MNFQITEKKPDFLEKIKINFSLKTTCGESIEFYINEKNNLTEEVFFYSSGSQLNLISANLICELIYKKEITLINENLNVFWNKFDIKLNGYRKESIENLLKNFKNEINKIYKKNNL